MSRKLPFFPRNIRRARIYGRRLGRAAMKARPKHPSIYFHIPKCGGTSISEAMYGTVPMNERVGVVDAVSTRRAAAIWQAGEDKILTCHDDFQNSAPVYALREQLLLQHLAWDTWLVHGHILFSDKADQHFGDRYRYVTILRHPIARTLSNYRMSAHEGNVPADFDAYLDSYPARAHAMTTLRYLSGTPVIEIGTEDAQLSQALDRLKKFSVIGFLEDLPQFASDYGDTFGVKLDIGKYNTAKGEEVDLSPSQMARLEELCAPDLALYEAARRAH